MIHNLFSTPIKHLNFKHLDLKSITKGKYTIKTVYSSDPELNDNMCESFYTKKSK